MNKSISFRRIIVFIAFVFMQKFSAAQLGLGMQTMFTNFEKTSSGIGGNNLGFQFGFDVKPDYSSFVWSISFAVNFALNDPHFTRSIDNVSFPEVELRSTYDFGNFGLGLSYYPIQGWESAIFNPFAHIHAGLATSGFEIYYKQNSFNELRLSYSDMKPNNTMAALFLRAAIGLDFSLSKLLKKGDDSDFSIRMVVNYDYISRMNFIDVNNVNGDNPVIGLVRDVQNQSTHVVQVGNLHRVAPKYLTFEIGFIWRIFDFGESPATNRTRQNEFEY